MASYIVVQRGMSNQSIYSALHHCASVIVFDITFVARLWQRAILREALLFEVAYSIVVCIGKKVVQVVLGRMIFKFIHES